MGVLIASGIVSSRKDGRWVHYRMLREQVEFKPLLDWIAKKLADDPSIARDAKILEEILACDPEEISRKQRIDSGCPVNEKMHGGF